MPDFDLADLLEVDTRSLNQAVRRNIDFLQLACVSACAGGMGNDVITKCDDISYKTSWECFTSGIYSAWGYHAGQSFRG